MDLEHQEASAGSHQRGCIVPVLGFTVSGDRPEEAGLELREAECQEQGIR